MRLYKLFSHKPGDVSSKYNGKPFIFIVRAKSIKQAYWLVANQRPAATDRSVGVVSIDHSYGPSKSWPFNDPLRTRSVHWNTKKQFCTTYGYNNRKFLDLEGAKNVSKQRSVVVMCPEHGWQTFDDERYDCVMCLDEGGD